MGLNLKDRANRARVSEMLKTWIKSGALKVTIENDERRKLREFSKVGDRA